MAKQRALAPLASLALGGMALVPATALAEEPIVDKVRQPRANTANSIRRNS